MMFDLKAVSLDLGQITTRNALLDRLAKALFVVQGVDCKNLDACIDVLSSLRIANHRVSRLELKPNDVVALHVLYLNQAEASVRQALITVVTGVNERVREMGQYPLLYLLLDDLQEAATTSLA